MSFGTLYIVSTPIGNLQDLSFRAVDVLTKVKIIACEDTRHTGLLLSRHPEPSSGSRFAVSNASSAEMLKPASTQRGERVQHDMKKARPTLLSYYEQNETQRIPQILNALINGVDVALVSDAGTPTISDPGFKLVRECIAQGIKVESIPGPSSVISALVVSGLPTDKFLFLGYLPKKSGKRKNILNELKCFETLKQIHPTIIFFESPHRLIQTLSDTKEIFGDVDIVVCRELTKIHEEVRREKLSESIAHFTKVTPKGEFVILFHR
ncbi:MAG: 16S rRNA (cytidine(1402)-2'-O)-methyltransferase [Candidatus Levybacteria bacterium RIFCSPHIGHO2_02_FULL_37_13]|nr:MAG: 16S rRNA (cytidine(1402)-2'-O)-methyltransferase [Candidatus Levybacteria bacterium RIFCSPHIGHO2_02_FULL_37_13]OGH29570.1 MAG: 16S rRNA (cytidine(1402)-2'-O)-methyltransferase [Candidatus Levybacteria bacterium RIFCSPHIGHO2_12_FULL_37_9]OGH39888.1 MAG: 16S rRNA (cytidine(1402)-2'-O)-methyltransferase [Candidatus Levybacteria bacterium RIFCSPLOWO2_01_FULL_37_26]